MCGIGNYSSCKYVFAVVYVTHTQCGRRPAVVRLWRVVCMFNVHTCWLSQLGLTVVVSVICTICTVPTVHFHVSLVLQRLKFCKQVVL